MEFYSASLFAKLTGCKQLSKYVMHKESHTLAPAHISVSHTFVTIWWISIKTVYSFFNFFPSTPSTEIISAHLPVGFWWDELLLSKFADACFSTTVVNHSIKIYSKYQLSTVNNDRSACQYRKWWVLLLKNLEYLRIIYVLFTYYFCFKQQ